MLHQMPRELLVTQLNNGLILLVLGMVIVFLFLTLLVFSTKFLSFFTKKFLPESAPSTPKRPVSPVAPDEGEAEIVAAIAAAVARAKH